MLYTSRFANPVLKSGDYTAVRISVGAPRWKPGYEIAGAIPDLMPKGLRHIKDRDTMRPLYYARLDSFGVPKIRKQIQYFESLRKPVVLLCFEDLRQGDSVWCHRKFFADWWQDKTGESIPELKDMSPVKITRNLESFNQQSLTEQEKS